MYLQKLMQHARAIVFCVGPQTGKEKIATIQAKLRPLVTEYFLHQCPVLILYKYEGYSDQLTPQELGDALEIDVIGTDNPWRTQCGISNWASSPFSLSSVSLLYDADVHAWKKDMIKEMEPGLSWLAGALETYFASVPPNFRSLGLHPSFLKTLPKDEKGNPIRPQTPAPAATPATSGTAAEAPQVSDDNRCIIS